MCNMYGAAQLDVFYIGDREIEALKEPIRLENKNNLTEHDLIAAGKTARFRLRANPTRKIETKSVGGQRRHGHRVRHRNDERCIDWLVRKGNDHGFEIMRDAQGQPKLLLIREPARRGRRNGIAITFEGVRFDGLLRIADPDAFRAGVINGIGPGKAFGFGLLSFAPI